MRKLLPLLTAIMLLATTACKKNQQGYGEVVEKSPTQKVKLVPRPKIMTDQFKYWALPVSEPIGLVLGDGVADHEKYGAEMFARNMKKRFGASIEIVNEEKADSYETIIWYGSKDKNEKVAELSKDNDWQLDEEIPGEQGFIIEMFDDGKRNILLGSVDGHGALYGQLSLFELFEKGDEGQMLLSLVSLADWPSIKRRGRTHFWRYDSHYDPEVIEAHVYARENYVDVNKYIIGKKKELVIEDEERFLKSLAEVKKRGFEVYGKIEAKMHTSTQDSMKMEIEEDLALGQKYLDEWKLDGVWATYNDWGMDENYAMFLNAWLDFCEKNDLEPDDIFFLPDDPGYKKIDYLPNLKIIEDVPRMKDITWVYTLNPDPYQKQLAEEVGLTQPFVYWWNWPRLQPDFTLKSGYSKTDKVQEPGYYYPRRFPVAWPWGFGVNPDFEKPVMRQIADNVGTVLQLSPDYQEEYIAIQFGIWAWNPEEYYFSDAVQYAREIIFGRELAHVAAEYDWTLCELRHNMKANENRPWKYKEEQWVRFPYELAMNLAKNLHYLKDNPYTLLCKERYQQRYIDAMENTTEVAFEYTGFDYEPDYFKQFELPEEMRNIRYFGYETKVEGAIEAELMTVKNRKGGYVKHFLGGANSMPDVSNDYVIAFYPTDYNEAWVELEFNAPDAGTYQVELNLNAYLKSPQVDVYINGEKAGRVDAGTKEVVFQDRSQVFENITLEKGANTIKFEPVNPKDKKRMFMLDYIKINK